MRLLANLKIRAKVLVALLPLAGMVIIAALYSSDRMSTIDGHYRPLLDKDVKALPSLTLAQPCNNKFGLYFYKQIAELDPDTMRMIDREIEQTIIDFHTALDEAKRENPIMPRRLTRSRPCLTKPSYIPSQCAQPHRRSGTARQ